MASREDKCGHTSGGARRRSVARTHGKWPVRVNTDIEGILVGAHPEAVVSQGNVVCWCAGVRAMQWRRNVLND